MGIRIEERPVLIQDIQEAIKQEEPVKNIMEEIARSVAQPLTDGTAMKAEKSLVGTLQAQLLLSQVPDRYEVGPSYENVRSGKAELHRGHASGGDCGSAQTNRTQIP